MNEMFHPAAISLTALLAGFYISWLAKAYSIKLPGYDDEQESDRQAWQGYQDRQGRFTKLV